MVLRIANILFLVLVSQLVSAQNKYWVLFKKDSTCLAYEKKQSAEKLCEDHINFLKRHKIQAVVTSDWLHASSAYLTQKDLATIDTASSIAEIRPVGLLASTKHSKTTTKKIAHAYSYALQQIEAHYLTEDLELTGEGVKIGIIDGGFRNANKDEALLPLIENDQLKYFKDYLLKRNKDPFYGKLLFMDGHGTDVWRAIAGFNKEKNIRYGMANLADFYLARTDHGMRESRMEEDYWIKALESFYKMGIRLVNSSLGYTNTFDKEKENHSVEEVDGKSTLITQAAQKASEKGMLLILSAGNDGRTKNWPTISLPSDAKGVLAIGATEFDVWEKQGYSSPGTDALPYVKPDLSCFAADGTSFAAPVITGLAACIWQYDSTLTNHQVAEILKNSAHLHLSPNSYLGYGVPNGKKIKALLTDHSADIHEDLTTINAQEDTLRLKVPKDIDQITVFHKTQNWLVNSQEELKVENGSLLLTRPDNIEKTTIVANDKFLTEVIWKAL